MLFWVSLDMYKITFKLKGTGKPKRLEDVMKKQGWLRMEKIHTDYKRWTWAI